MSMLDIARRPQFRMSIAQIITTQLIAAVMVVMMLGGARASTMLPCSINATTPQRPLAIQSNMSYTLADCLLSSSSSGHFVFLVPQVSSTFGNVTIDVTGGNVLPFLKLVPPFARIDNMTITIRGVGVSSSSQLYGNAVLWVVGIAALTNVNITVEASTIAIASPLLYCVTTGVVSGIDIVIRNSTIVTNLSAFVLVDIDGAMIRAQSNGSCSNVVVIIDNSSVVMVVDTSGVARASVGQGSVIWISASIVCRASVVVSGSSSLTSAWYARTGNISIGTLAVSGDRIEDVHANVSVGTNISVRSVCVIGCADENNTRFVSFVAAVTGISMDASIHNVALHASNAYFLLDAPRTPFVFKLGGAIILNASLMSFSSITVVLAAHALGYASIATKYSAVAVVQDIVVSRGLSIILDDVVVRSEIECGACPEVSTMVAELLGDAVQSTVSLQNVVLVASVVSGPLVVTDPKAGGAFVGRLTMGSMLLHLGPRSGQTNATCGDLVVRIVNASLTSEHALTLPAMGGAALVLVMMSLIAAIISTTSLSSSALHLSEVYVLRLSPRSWPQQSVVGFQQNGTLVLCLCDLVAAAPTAFAAFFDAPIVTSFVAVATTLANCSASYEARLALSTTDALGLIALPSLLSSSTIQVASSTTSADIVGGLALPLLHYGLVGSIGGTVLQNCSVGLHDVAGGYGTALVVVDGKNMTLLDTTFVFASAVVVVRRSSNTLLMPSFVAFSPVVAGGGFINVAEPTSELRGSRFTITSCQFEGYHQLLNASMFVIRQSHFVVELGCNLWDDAPLLPSAIGYDAFLRSHIVYPQSQWNATFMCLGFLSSSTLSATASRHVSHSRLSLPASTTKTQRLSVSETMSRASYFAMGAPTLRSLQSCRPMCWWLGRCCLAATPVGAALQFPVYNGRCCRSTWRCAALRSFAQIQTQI